MKCPSCGAPMQEGQMYCEHCGKEIQIVPEFESEIDNSIREAMSDVATELAQPAADEKKPFHKKGRFGRLDRKKKLAFFFTAVVLAALGISVGVAAIQYFMPDYQYQSAAAYMKEKDYENAASHFERAVSLSPNNVSYLNGLSSCYYAMGKQEEAKALCLEMISLEGSNEEAYRRFVAISEKQKDYEGINELMQGCRDKEIRNLYLDYMANPPEFNIPGGTYHEVQTVKLIGNAAGTIYYTVNGGVADENDPVYTNPITLESGTYKINALFVNQYGVKSKPSTETYFIDVSRPDPPEVEPLSGTYEKPWLISVEVPEGCKVYYTTDKTDPGAGSTLYEEAFWMPVGNSTLRFVTVSAGGVSGDITERKYTLNLHPVMSMEAAKNQLVLTLKNAGVVSSLQGDVPGKKGRNLYTYKYALTINEHHYYLYREYYEEAENSSNATGNDYVVNYMSGECYRAVQQQDKTFKLYTIESLVDGTEEGES